VLEIYALDTARGRYTRELGATEGTIESVPGCDGLTLDLNVRSGRASSGDEPIDD
jgi:hypothetical protein